MRGTKFRGYFLNNGGPFTRQGSCEHKTMQTMADIHHTAFQYATRVIELLGISLQRTSAELPKAIAKKVSIDNRSISTV